MRVLSLHRYPVKSMLGERVASVQVGERGLVGDRVVAVVDPATGRIASAKNPRLWRQLLMMRARTTPSHRIELLLGDGKRVPWDDPAAAGLVSEVLGREVELTDRPPVDPQLERSDPDAVLAAGVEQDVPFTVSTTGSGAPSGTFFDFAPVHIVAAATLRGLGQQDHAVRYRPNLVVGMPGDGGSTSTPPFGENAWLGRRLQLGSSGPEFEIFALTPRCAVPTLDHGGTGRDVEALRGPAERNRVVPLAGLAAMPCVGVYGRVLRPGPVRVGDPVEVR